MKHLYYIVKGVIGVYEDCDMAKIKRKLLRKVAEERNLKLGKTINLNLISTKKPRYGGSNHWILIQD